MDLHSNVGGVVRVPRRPPPGTHAAGRPGRPRKPGRSHRSAARGDPAAAGRPGASETVAELVIDPSAAISRGVGAVDNGDIARRYLLVQANPVVEFAPGSGPDEVDPVAVHPSSPDAGPGWTSSSTSFPGSRAARMCDEFRDGRASHLPHAVSHGVLVTLEGCPMDIVNLGKADGLPPVDWAAVVAKLAAGSAPAPDAVNSRTTWLSTVNEDGSPHVTAVGALWLDGTFWFQTGAGTRKGRNVARDPRCSLALSIRDADVVIEGDAARVTEPGAVARIAKAWADSGWPAEPDDSGSGITAPFNAPSQGPPPWNVYRIEPRSAIVTMAEEPGGLTRFLF